MPRRKPASVFCLETPWDDDLRHQATVRPMLEMLQLRCGMEFIHRDAATEAVTVSSVASMSPTANITRR